MTSTRYNTDELICDLVSGSRTLKQIAEKHKITHKHLQTLVRGDRRPAFKRKLDRMRRLADQETVRLGKAMREEMILDHYHMSKRSKAETGRRCREFLLRLFPPGPDRDDAYAAQAPPRPDPRRELEIACEKLRTLSTKRPHGNTASNQPR